MNTWQRLGQTPERFTVAYHDAVRGKVRAILLEYKPSTRSWWAYERTYKAGSIPPTKEHAAIWHRLTPQEQAICALQFPREVSDGAAPSVLHLTGVKLSEALTMLEVPLFAASPADFASPLW